MKGQSRQYQRWHWGFSKTWLHFMTFYTVPKDRVWIKPLRSSRAVCNCIAEVENEVKKTIVPGIGIRPGWPQHEESMQHRCSYMYVTFVNAKGVHCASGSKLSVIIRVESDYRRATPTAGRNKKLTPDQAGVFSNVRICGKQKQNNLKISAKFAVSTYLQFWKLC